MIVVLFDIDGTLLLTDRAGQESMEQIRMPEARPKQTSTIQYAGRTDRSIVADHLQRLGLEDTEENFRKFQLQFLQRLPHSLATRDGFVLPGVIDTLDRLSANATVRLGLLTGNMREAAEMKLCHFGLDPYFRYDRQFVGGFGDRFHERDDVAREALEDVRTKFDPHVDLKHIWVVGDTPRDIQCARAIQVQVLAVATGSYPVQQLAKCKPDVCAESLVQAEAWWQQLSS